MYRDIVRSVFSKPSVSSSGYGTLSIFMAALAGSGGPPGAAIIGEIAASMSGRLLAGAHRERRLLRGLAAVGPVALHVPRPADAGDDRGRHSRGAIEVAGDARVREHRVARPPNSRPAAARSSACRRRRR